MKIYQTRTVAGYFFISFFAAFAMGFVFSVIFRDDRSIAITATTFAISFLAAFNLDYNARRAWNRLQGERIRFAKKYKYEYSPGGASNVQLSNRIALSHIPKSRDERFYNYIQAKDWSYCDFTYNYYRKHRQGEYIAGRVYYGIMFTQIPRALPNVFFDSKKSRGRQFRFTFARNQKHSLEGDFDTYFTTYFPKDYTIDSMSFISPDVMQELKNASEYDIEIVGDLVCLYGPVSTNEQDILKMAAKLQKIKSQLMDNITTYRDERLPFSVGRKQVAVEGMTLGASKFLARLSLFALVLYLAFHIASILMNMSR